MTNAYYAMHFRSMFIYKTNSLIYGIVNICNLRIASSFHQIDDQTKFLQLTEYTQLNNGMQPLFGTTTIYDCDSNLQ